MEPKNIYRSKTNILTKAKDNKILINKRLQNKILLQYSDTLYILVLTKW